MSGMPIELYKIFGDYGAFEDIFSDPLLLAEGIDDYYKKLMDKREGVYADAGLKTCILDGGLAGMLAHEAVGHTVEADLVIGGSVAGSFLNRQVPPACVVNDLAYASERPRLCLYMPMTKGLPRDAELIKTACLSGI
jgi:TldD protein